VPTSLILGQASSFSDLYAYGLSSRFNAGQRIWPTNYELSQDPQFWEKVNRDPVVAHAATYRRHLVAGPDYVISPGGTGEKDKAVASIFEDLFKRIESFATTRYNLAEAVFRGGAYARIFGKYERFKAGGLPYTQRWWCPTKLQDIDARRVGRWVTPDQRVETKFWNYAKREWVKTAHPEWIIKHIYADREETLGFGAGVYESLYYSLMIKTRIQQEMAAAAERWGQGLTVIKLDPEAKGLSLADAANAYIDVMERAKGRHFIAHDARDEITVLPGPGTGWQIMTEQLNYHDSKITVLLLGSLLPTQAQTGGSYAMAQVQESSTDALVRYDRSLLSETITRDLIGLTWDLNRPALANLGLLSAAMPIFQILDDKIEDPQVAATVAQTALAMGLRLRLDEVYKKINYSVPTDRDECIEPTIAASAMGADPQALGLPSDDAEMKENPEAQPQATKPSETSETSASPGITASHGMVGRAPARPTNGSAKPGPSRAALAAHEAVRSRFSTVQGARR